VPQTPIAQVPDEHEAVAAFVGAQVTPQPPQLMSVFSGVSQPSVGSPLQSA
jgi:hypothetical protein